MKEHPILFKGRLVRAILDGKKTQTRRVPTPYTSQIRQTDGKLVPMPKAFYKAIQWESRDVKIRRHHFEAHGTVIVPRVQVGDLLWVKETFYCDDYRYPDGPVDAMRSGLDFQATHDCNAWEAGCPCKSESGRSEWRPSIHMPRWASRLSLRVEDVRCDRVNMISGAECIAEGVDVSDVATTLTPEGDRRNRQWIAKGRFEQLWNEINAPRGWAFRSLRPVWIYQFRVERTVQYGADRPPRVSRVQSADDS